MGSVTRGLKTRDCTEEKVDEGAQKTQTPKFLFAAVCNAKLSENFHTHKISCLHTWYLNANLSLRSKPFRWLTDLKMNLINV